MNERAWLPSYEAFLASPEWSVVRDRVMQRAEHICEYCDNPATEVHHCTYRVLDHPGLCVAVCRGCHEELEEDRADDPVAHLMDAPGIQKWATRRFGVDHLQRYSRREIGQAWIDYRNEMARETARDRD